jgi:hypothetical protein
MSEWNPLTEPVDKLKLSGRMSPGLCEIVGASSPRNWEEIAGYGWSGALLRFRGVKLSHFAVRFKLYTTADWADWIAFRPLLAKPPFGKRPRALDIWHPLLVEVGIGSVVVEDFLAPEQSEDGVWVVEAKLIEYRNPKYTLSTPTGSAATEVDPYEIEIAANSSTIDELSDP